MEDEQVLNSCDLPMVPSPKFRGFRRRWTSRANEPEGDSASDVAPDAQLLTSSVRSWGFVDDGLKDDRPSAAAFLEHDANTQDDFFGGLDSAPSVGEVTNDPHPRICDPAGRETSWRQAAFEATSKRVRLNLPKMPWEESGVSAVFRAGSIWDGSIVAGYEKLMAPQALGLSDVLESEVVASVASSSKPPSEITPVTKLVLAGSRKETTDDDLRRTSLHRFRTLILQDPRATELGASLLMMREQGCLDGMLDQSFSDCFRAKASSTLYKRSASLGKLALLLKARGCLYPLRLTELQLYLALCDLRDAEAGATSGQHIIESLFFLEGTARFKLVSIQTVVSGRCKGVARDMFLGKSPLSQRGPLSVQQVIWLEQSMEQVDSVQRCILGQILFCIHACCRWKDSQRLRRVDLEEDAEESVLHGEAMSSKTAVTLEAKTRFLPYIALGSGVSKCSWGKLWLQARLEQRLDGLPHFLPSFSERAQSWTDNPLSASEATYWLRDFLSPRFAGSDILLLGSHSCKATILTWAGRCVEIAFTPPERRLLGHHLDPGMKSIMVYSREAYVTLYARVLQMFRLIRSGDFDPDRPAISRIVQSQSCPKTGPQSQVEPPAEPLEVNSDSDSSVASDEAGQLFGDETVHTLERPSALDEFLSVPDEGLAVHSLSGLVHVINEDETLLCGRRMSVNFRLFSDVACKRDNCECCVMCVKSFNRHRQRDSN